MEDRGIDSPAMELQVLVSYLMWMLSTELDLSAGGARAMVHTATSSPWVWL